VLAIDNHEVGPGSRDRLGGDRGRDYVDHAAKQVIGAQSLFQEHSATIAQHGWSLRACELEHSATPVEARVEFVSR
jgi:hypothetical protein